MKIISIIAVSSLLFICSIYDIKKQEIPVLPIYLSGILGITCWLFATKEQIMSSVFGFLSGSLIFLLSKLLKGSIGEGDGLLLMSTGLFLGIKENIILLFIALFLACIGSILLVLIKKAKASTTIPFVPFLLLSYMVILFTINK